MEETVTIIEAVIAITLTITYFKLCSGREMGVTAKITEIVSLYGINMLAFLGKIKFWALLVGFAVIGLIKLLTTKQQKIERRNKGFVN